MSNVSTILFSSDFYSIIDFKCKCNLKSTSCVECQPDFTMSYVRKGNFIFNVFRNSLDAYNGWILFDKPDNEHTVTHFDGMPDECTIFKFSNEFCERLISESGELERKFFKNSDVCSLLVKANAEFEYLHFMILQNINADKKQKVLIDSLVLEMLYSSLGNLFDLKNNIPIPERIKRNHLSTIEKAKQFINQKFDDDISLFDIADYSFVSPFHFSRVFKTLTSYSPYQYLLDTRLKNAELLIKTTDLPVTQICFASGFQNLEHFSSAFKNKYKFPPSRLRK